MEENKPLCPDAAEDARDGLIFDIQQDPYNYVMRVVFCRWKPFILRAMDFDEGKLTHFSRFTKQLPITQKVLSENLRQLEADGLIYRTVLPTTPPQVEYRLTPAGKSLVPCWTTSTTGAGRRCSAGGCPSTRWAKCGTASVSRMRPS